MKYRLSLAFCALFLLAGNVLADAASDFAAACKQNDANLNSISGIANDYTTQYNRWEYYTELTGPNDTYGIKTYLNLAKLYLDDAATAQKNFWAIEGSTTTNDTIEQTRYVVWPIYEDQTTANTMKTYVNLQSGYGSSANSYINGSSYAKGELDTCESMCGG